MLLVLDGFDKYGGINSNTTVVPALLTAGEWTNAGTCRIVAGLSATGYALHVVAPANIIKTLGSSYSRLIGGFRFQGDLGGICGIVFRDGATAQASVSINALGTISVRNGNFNSTIIATSTATITANSTHYLEFDISFGNAALFQVWLDGVSIIGPITGDTTTTANNFANGFVWEGGTTNTVYIDDLYLFDTTGATNNAVLLTSPRVETQFPSSDGAVQFAIGASMLGSSTVRNGGGLNTVINQLRLHNYTPAVNMTLNSIAFSANATNAVIQLRPVIYSDSSGSSNALLGTGPTSVGTTAGTAKVLPFTTPVSLVAGTQYWLGFMYDIAVSLMFLLQDSLTGDRTATATFSSGAPGTAPATIGATTATFWGNTTVTGNNWYQTQNPPQGNLSYVYDDTIGHEDLYNFPALTAPSPTIYAVAVKGSIAKSDSGAKTFTLRTKSGATDSAGSASSLAPGTSYGWLTSLFPSDPATSAAWSLSGLNAAQAGVRVET